MRERALMPLDVALRRGPSPAFAEDVRLGLCGTGQKTLPPKYLYDALGSALFEAITRLPEYGLWRAERSLLRKRGAEIAEYIRATNVVELGSGSANKTIELLESLLGRGPVSYCAIDVSPTALDMTRRELAGLRGLGVRVIEGDYLPALASAMRFSGPRARTLALFLGSSLGNLDAKASEHFLRGIRSQLRPDDGLLLGADLESSGSRLLAAYDDALGVTAAFNLNLLVRMNRELGANFSLPRFRHRARFTEATHDVEMHLESLRAQTVTIGALGRTISLRAGETIHTESSHKYSLEELDRLLRGSGFRCEARWVDREWPFCSGLYRADAAPRELSGS